MYRMLMLVVNEIRSEVRISAQSEFFWVDAYTHYSGMACSASLLCKPCRGQYRVVSFRWSTSTMKMRHIIYLHLVVVVILRANVLELVDYHVSVLHDVPLPLMGQRAMG